MLNEITPLILTYNEAANIGRTLERLAWAREIVVVDSFSDDETVEIASSFANVRVIQRVFDCHRSQWTPITSSPMKRSLNSKRSSLTRRPQAIAQPLFTASTAKNCTAASIRP
jgi:hypothetical protein